MTIKKFRETTKETKLEKRDPILLFMCVCFLVTICIYTYMYFYPEKIDITSICKINGNIEIITEYDYIMFIETSKTYTVYVNASVDDCKTQNIITESFVYYEDAVNKMNQLMTLFVK